MNEGGGRDNRALLKPLLTENHRIKRLKRMESKQVIFTDATTLRVKEMDLEKKGRANCQASMFGVACQTKDSVA